MKKAYFLVVLFLSGLSVGNLFAAAPTPTWDAWLPFLRGAITTAAGTRDLDRELLETAKETNPNKAKIERLIKEGANPNTTDENGFTILMWIAGKFLTEQDHYIDTVQLLLDAGADVNAVSENGFTALMIAVQNDHTATVELLLDKGADVNAQDKEEKRTALMHAATMHSYPEIVQLLLDHGADKNIQNNGGETAEEMARRLGRTENANIIRDYVLPSGRLTKRAVR